MSFWSISQVNGLKIDKPKHPQQANSLPIFVYIQQWSKLMYTVDILQSENWIDEVMGHRMANNNENWEET